MSVADLAEEYARVRALRQVNLPRARVCLIRGQGCGGQVPTHRTKAVPGTRPCAGGRQPGSSGRGDAWPEWIQLRGQTAAQGGESQYESRTVPARCEQALWQPLPGTSDMTDCE